MARRVGWKKSSGPYQQMTVLPNGRATILSVGVKKFTRQNSTVYEPADRIVVENSEYETLASLTSTQARQVALAILDRCNQIDGVK